MNVGEILAALERDQDGLPSAALEEAANHRDEITPYLLGVLEGLARDPQPYLDDNSRAIHIYAMYLLALFRETRAYPLLIKIFSAPGEMPFDLIGDIVTFDLGSILASVSGGDPSGMMELAENESANEFVRDAALEGLVTLVACGKRTRDETMAYFSRLFHALKRRPSYAWTGLANACTDLWPFEIEADLRQAYDEGLIEPLDIDWAYIEDKLARGKESALRQLQHDKKLITDIAEQISWWESSQEGEEETDDEQADDDDLLAEDTNEGQTAYDDLWAEDTDEDEAYYNDLLAEALSFRRQLEAEGEFPETYRRPGPKVGRNDPCPCGSGKKYKKCCGR